jgi:hypothetical protein
MLESIHDSFAIRINQIAKPPAFLARCAATPHGIETATSDAIPSGRASILAEKTTFQPSSTPQIFIQGN